MSAIANPTSLESPGALPLYENDINAQEKHEIYQQVIQLESNEAGRMLKAGSPIKQVLSTNVAYGQPQSAARFGAAGASSEKDQL